MASPQVGAPAYVLHERLHINDAQRAVLQEIRVRPARHGADLPERLAEDGGAVVGERVFERSGSVLLKVGKLFVLRQRRASRGEITLWAVGRGDGAKVAAETCGERCDDERECARARGHRQCITIYYWRAAGPFQPLLPEQGRRA